MTEQIIRQEIEVNEQRIISSFSDLTAAAKNVGYDGCKAAQSAREIGMKREKNGYIRFYIIIFILGFSIIFIVSRSIDANIPSSLVIALVGGVYFWAIFLTLWARIRKPMKKYKEIQSKYDSMVDTAEKQREVLTSTLENTRRI